MGVSALVVTLSDQLEKARWALQNLAEHPLTTLGDRHGRRLPLVLDTPSVDQDKAAFDWIQRLTGVDHVDVVSIHFDEPAEECPHVVLNKEAQ